MENARGDERTGGKNTITVCMHTERTSSDTTTVCHCFICLYYVALVYHFYFQCRARERRKATKKSHNTIKQRKRCIEYLHTHHQAVVRCKARANNKPTNRQAKRKTGGSDAREWDTQLSVCGKIKWRKKAKRKKREREKKIDANKRRIPVIIIICRYIVFVRFVRSQNAVVPLTTTIRYRRARAHTHSLTQSM